MQCILLSQTPEQYHRFDYFNGEHVLISVRLLFTHGLHLNESGKELLSNQLPLHMFSIPEEVSIKPITLGWYDKNLQVNVSSVARPSHALTPITCQLSTEQAPKRIKKFS